MNPVIAWRSQLRTNLERRTKLGVKEAKRWQEQEKKKRKGKKKEKKLAKEQGLTIVLNQAHIVTTLLGDLQVYR